MFFKYPDFPQPKKGKNVLVLRYGAYGDHVVASSVLPYLKKDGYKITYNCTEWGYEVLKCNPYIDDFWVQITDQVAIKDLDDHWDKIKVGFDKVVQLNQSIEVECVSIQGRDVIAQDDKWGIHRELRRKKYNINF